MYRRVAYRCGRRAPAVAVSTGASRQKGQDTVRCAECDRFCYNAPRSETGREARSLRTRPTIRPSQRTRILMRDKGACVLCHPNVGHFISVYDGQKLGLSDGELASDDNLAAMCAACNSGLSTESLPPRLLAAALWARANGAATRREA